MFSITLFLVKVMRIELKESFDRDNLVTKLIAVILLSLGSILII